MLQRKSTSVFVAYCYAAVMCCCIYCFLCSMTSSARRMHDSARLHSAHQAFVPCAFPTEVSSSQASWLLVRRRERRKWAALTTRPSFLTRCPTSTRCRRCAMLRSRATCQVALVCTVIADTVSASTAIDVQQKTHHTPVAMQEELAALTSQLKAANIGAKQSLQATKIACGQAEAEAKSSVVRNPHHSAACVSFANVLAEHRMRDSCNVPCP